MVPFFHYPGVDYPRFSVPLLFPSIAALVGASFPCRSCLYVAIATLVLAYWISGKIKPCKYFSPRAFLLTLLAFILGTTKGLSWNNTIQTIHNIVDGKVVPVEVLVLNTPSDSEYYTSFKGMVRGGSEQYKVMVQAALYRQGEIRTGNVVKVEGKFHIPRHPLNPGEFNYPRYLAGQKIFVELKGTVKHVSDDARLCLRSTAAQVREYICSRIDFLIPPPEASVMKAILVGERGCISKENLQSLQKSGFARFLSATGFHVGILGYLVYRTWKKISKGEKSSRITACIIVLVYGCLAGWTPGVIRGATCFIVSSCSWMFRRKYHPMSGIAASALLIALIYPYPLRDTGFQLSYAGALGAFAGWRIRPGSQTARFLGAIAGVFPFMCLHFNDVSVAGLVLGSIWTSLGTVLIICGWLCVLHPWLAWLFGWFPFLLARGILDFGAIISRIPFASMAFPAPTATEIVTYVLLYLVILSVFGCRGRYQLFKYCLVLISSSFLFLSCFLRVYAPQPEVAFLSVGQADCAVVRYRQTVIMVDTGTESSFKNQVLPYLRYKGITSIDLCIISHLDQDHAGGLPMLCRELKVHVIATYPGGTSRLQNITGDSKHTTIEFTGGTVYRVGGVTIRTPALPPMLACLSRNHRSLVLSMEFDGKLCAVEFWGDAPGDIVSEALHSPVFAGSVGSRVIKVPHHGSYDAFIPLLYERDNVSCGVISVGSNIYGHPSEILLKGLCERKVPYWRTDLHGCITLKVYKQSETIVPYVKKDNQRKW